VCGFGAPATARGVISCARPGTGAALLLRVIRVDAKEGGRSKVHNTRVSLFTRVASAGLMIETESSPEAWARVLRHFGAERHRRRVVSHLEGEGEDTVSVEPTA